MRRRNKCAGAFKNRNPPSLRDEELQTSCFSKNLKTSRLALVVEQVEPSFSL